jgi:hypothetical protein
MAETLRGCRSSPLATGRVDAAPQGETRCLGIGLLGLPARGCRACREDGDA